MSKQKFGLIDERGCNGGIQKIYRFPNGFGASVVRHEYSYGGKDGLWELAVIRFNAKGEWGLSYDTRITSDVIGHRTDKQIAALLKRIKALTKSSERAK